MSSLSRRQAVVCAAASLSLAAAGPAALAAQGASAATPPAPVQAPSLLGGILDPVGGLIGTLTGTLGGVLNTVLGATQLTQLNGVTTALTGGSAPSPATLTNLQTVLGQVAGSTTGSDQTLITGVSQLLGTPAGGTSASAIPSVLLAPVSGLLGQLSGLSGISGTQAASLSSLQTAIDNVIGSGTALSPVGGLPVVGSLSLTQPAGLDTLVSALQGGATPTGDLLGPIVTLLTQAAGQAPGGSVLASALSSLATSLGGVTGQLSPSGLSTVGQSVRSVGQTQGVKGTPLGDVLGTLSDLLGGLGVTTGGTTGGTTGTTPTTTGTTPGTTPGTTIPGLGRGTTTTAVRRGTMRLKGVRVDRGHTKLTLTLACPAGGGDCAALLFAMNGRRVVGTPASLALGQGQSASRTIRLDGKSRKALKRRAMTTVVAAATSRSLISHRTLRIGRTKAAKKHTAKKHAKRS